MVEYNEIRNRVDTFLSEWPLAQWGDAYRVLEDFLLADEAIKVCIEKLNDPALQGIRTENKHSSTETQATIDFLNHLLEIPEADRLEAQYFEDDLRDQEREDRYL